ncbi:hypothetical protein HPB51_027976 [Rhipicephalus microplus]|uniref:Uncharacterized protein n=1 Tax=Rhipicephalus microplus TaxID=6941 RepID=A0A9J6CY94_RHIMP|nr:hypothetical protein HPB51_027976 [Rhipicephalus microplus]
MKSHCFPIEGPGGKDAVALSTEIKSTHEDSKALAFTMKELASSSVSFLVCVLASGRFAVLAQNLADARDLPFGLYTKRVLRDVPTISRHSSLPPEIQPFAFSRNTALGQRACVVIGGVAPFSLRLDPQQPPGERWRQQRNYEVRQAGHREHRHSDAGEGFGRGHRQLHVRGHQRPRHRQLHRDARRPRWGRCSVEFGQRTTYREIPD